MIAVRTGVAAAVASRRARMMQVLAATLLAGASIGAAPDNNSPEKQTSGYLEVGGSKIYYETRGSGPAIVLLHDGLLHAVSWNEVWPKLAARFQVIRYDRRGYGRSDPASKSYSSTGDLLALLTHLKIEHSIIAGSSSGGALAIDFAIEHPQVVDGLFLIGPVLHGMEYSADFRERANRNNAPMERGDVKAWAKNWAQDRFLIGGANKNAREKIYEQLVANAEKLKKFDGALEAKLAPPASKRLSEIKVPTVILEGDTDIADVHVHCDEITSGIRGSERIVVKDAGHLIQLEKADEVARRLENFAQRCERK